jgi:hypothetical protein
MAATPVATPDQLIAYAIEGRLSKHALAGLLTAAARRSFSDACGRIEQRFTNECRDLKDPCLASGCSADGERCLQPLLRAGIEYYRECGAEWAKLFADAVNRDASWKVTASHYEIRP